MYPITKQNLRLSFNLALCDVRTACTSFISYFADFADIYARKKLDALSIVDVFICRGYS